MIIVRWTRLALAIPGDLQLPADRGRFVVIRDKSRTTRASANLELFCELRHAEQNRLIAKPIKIDRYYRPGIIFIVRAIRLISFRFDARRSSESIIILRTAHSHLPILFWSFRLVATRRNPCFFSNTIFYINTDRITRWTIRSRNQRRD